jgi:hypothetical protein
MDVRIEATCAVAKATVVDAVVSTLTRWLHQAIVRLEQVASFSRLSIGGTSLSAVSPDNDFRRGTAVAVN